jgi:hypothetical protein
MSVAGAFFERQLFQSRTDPTHHPSEPRARRAGSGRRLLSLRQGLLRFGGGGDRETTRRTYLHRPQNCPAVTSSAGLFVALECYRQRTRPHRSRQHQVQRNRPQRSRQHRLHPTSTTSPLRLLSTLFENGTTCIAVALVDPAAARKNPARAIAIAVLGMARPSLAPDDNAASWRKSASHRLPPGGLVGDVWARIRLQYRLATRFCVGPAAHDVAITALSLAASKS